MQLCQFTDKYSNIAASKLRYELRFHRLLFAIIAPSVRGLPMVQNHEFPANAEKSLKKRDTTTIDLSMKPTMPWCFFPVKISQKSSCTGTKL
jgi:hypothetical protein